MGTKGAKTAEKQIKRENKRRRNESCSIRHEIQTLELTRSRHQRDEDGQDGEKSVGLLILIPTLGDPYEVYRIPHDTPLNGRPHMGPHRRIAALWGAREAWGVDVCGGVVRVEKKTPHKDHRHHNDPRYDGDAKNAFNSTSRRHV